MADADISGAILGETIPDGSVPAIVCGGISSGVMAMGDSCEETAFGAADSGGGACGTSSLGSEIFSASSGKIREAASSCSLAAESAPSTSAGTASKNPITINVEARR